ncbi:L-tryptophan dehydrogenase-like [Tachypleus tridentatus]|uniref:L-tryptophan dehydrogenase-like n=1 Tax=Tachypleus tridentatus TaxID=6853 RepID=UPI003FD2D9A4
MNFSSTAAYDETKKSTTDFPLLSLSPNQFADFMREKNINRCFAVWNESERKVMVSHPEIQQVADWMTTANNSSMYKNHEGIFLQLGLRTGCLLGVFIWKTNRGQACGGIRMLEYHSMEKYLQEGLRLSTRLGIKSALAGLWIGGGKGLISEPPNRQGLQPEFRQKLFFDFGDFVSSLNGCYSVLQMLQCSFPYSRWTVSIPGDIGGSVNAANLLGRGVVCATEAALDSLQLGTVKGKSVAIQGAGGIGMNVARLLLDRDVGHLYITDVSKKRVEDVKDILAHKFCGRVQVEKVPIGDMSILNYKCDILSPCALGHIFNTKNVSKVEAKIICGSANAQVEDEGACRLLQDQGTTYVVDYIPNRMALVNSVYESLGRMENDPWMEEHFDKSWEHSIYVLTRKVLKDSLEHNITVLEAANQIAEIFEQQEHPLWPGRTRAIIQGLLDGGWHEGREYWKKRKNFAFTDFV